MMTEHPDPVLQQRQQAAVENMREEQRDFLARMFRFGNLTYRYYQRPEAEPTEEDFKEWLEGLPPNLAAAEREQGFDECRKGFPLRRYALEKSDIGLEEFMRQHLSDDDYAEWCKSKPDQP
jgi:uncharacterized membrane protein YgaE (UPF0421/DUF939 family)